MHEIITLLKPRLLSLKHGGRLGSRAGRPLMAVVLILVGGAFWSGLFALSYRVLHHFKGIADIGDLLNYKLLSMVLITAFALLVFSAILTSLSKLYLSRDLYLVHAMPVAVHKVFTARWIDSVIDSSWMVVVYTLPIFAAFGIVYHSGALFYLVALLAVPALAVIASGIGTAFVVMAVLLVPAGRMKSVFIFLSVLFFVIVYLAIRLMKPELLVDPDVYDTVLVYFSALQTPTSPFIPSTWTYDALKASLAGHAAESAFHLALSWSFSGLLTCLLVGLSGRIYFCGFSKSQTAQVRFVRNIGLIDRCTALLPGTVQAYARKELKSFLRDQTQWSQLFLIAALVIIYVYNFKVLPLERSPIQTVYLQNLLSFLNMTLALFVLTAIAGRFAYPAVSVEREAFWIVRSSPGSIRSFLWIKFAIYLVPLLALTEILIVATNVLLAVTPMMMMLSTISVAMVVPGIVSMGIGLGAAYPDFKAENPAQAVTSFGGLIFMILCAGYILLVVALEAGPVYRMFMADHWGRSLTALEWIWAVGSFAAAGALAVAAVVLPMLFGEKKLAVYPI
jgi:ABC-2 type transport system permease protein